MGQGCKDRRLKGQGTVITQITFPGGEVSLGDKGSPRFLKGPAWLRPPGGPRRYCRTEVCYDTTQLPCRSTAKFVRKRNPQYMAGV